MGTLGKLGFFKLTSTRHTQPTASRSLLVIALSASATVFFLLTTQAKPTKRLGSTATYGDPAPYWPDVILTLRPILSRLVSQF